MSRFITSSSNELELEISQAINELEKIVPDLRILRFKSLREFEVAGGKKALIIFVPVPLMKSFQKIQTKVTRELEKKFADTHIIFLAERRILPKPSRVSRQEQKRPRSRTLTAVHDKILQDLVFPTEIVGKRVRYLQGGNKLQKIMLDSNDLNLIDYKLDSFQSVYNKLTGKQVVFEISN